MVARTDAATARGVLSAKVDGMGALAPLLRERRLDFVILCSSTAGLVGEPGQVAYCAANAALDAWAHHLRRDGVPAIAIDWCAWRDVGMAARTQVPADLKAWRARTLAAGISPDDGAAVFLEVLAAGLQQVVVVPATNRAADKDVDADAALTSEPAEETAPGMRSGRPDLPRPYAPPVDDVQVQLTRIWEDLLGVAPIGIDDDFLALNGHSLLATRILAAIWRDFRVEMSLAEFFDYPTIAQAADEIVVRQIAGYDPAAVEAALAEIKAAE
jgi:hypothetical protein